MENVINQERICPLCGKTIHYKVIEDDGMDWEGHQRGHYSSRIIGDECDCDGKNLKKMCINCIYYGNCSKTCESKDLIKEIQDRFKEPSFITLPKINVLFLTSITNCCKYWKINPDIAAKLFK